MIILGVESTCDETGVAIVEDGKKVIANVLASSSDILKKYGGVVPEVAAREQVKIIIPLINRVLDDFSINKIDALAVSYGPGLVGSLLIGVETVKTLALVFKKPLIGVNHLIGHFYSSYLAADKEPQFSAVGLIVSGGHTDLVLVENHGVFKHLGGTLDDAAGEAFDKVARFLKLSYPGGPAIEKEANSFLGNKDVNLFSSPLIDAANFDFSFSGLKTAVTTYVEKNKIELTEKNVEDISFFFQKACIEVLVKKTLKASEKFSVKSIVVGGGVAANESLKKAFIEKLNGGLNFYYPEKKFAVDNGAMIAAAAFYNQNFINPLQLSVDPILYF